MATAAKKAPAAKKATKKAAAPAEKDEIIDAIEEVTKKPKFDVRNFYRSTIDDVSRRQGVEADPMEDITPLSTGLLSLDLMYGGGIRPAMYTHAGDEQTAKTTLALMIMVNAINKGVPTIAFWDYEGSTKNSKPYLASILKTMGAKCTIRDVFGKKDKETGKWLTEPVVQYYPETVGEKFFDWLAALERQYPDKRLVAGKWWLIYEDTKVNKAMVGDYHDPKMAKKYGKGLWVEAPDGNLQAVVVVDSYPAMNPDSNDDEEADNSLGVHARFFAKHLPRIKGRMGKKMIALLGMNQLSDIPMAMYGPKQQESCGKKLRYYSDVRIWNTKRGSGMPFNAVFDKEEGLEIEKSVTGKGNDSYRYIQTKTAKNKLWIPGRKAWFRIWVSDAEGNGCGLDPFFDVMMYLRDTGQMLGNERKKLRLRLDGLPPVDKVNWMQLKEWVLGTKEQKVAICKTFGIDKPFCLKAWCFKQAESGKGEALYVAKKGEKVASEDEE